MKSIYIKPSKRKCSISDFNCFDIFDENNIGMTDCDVISVECNGEKYHQIQMEVVDGMVHIWSHLPIEFYPIINTLIIRFKGVTK